MAAQYSSMEDPDMDSPGAEAVDDGAHEKLLNSIFALDGKKRQNNVVRGISSTSSSLDLIVHANKESTKIQPQDLQLKNSNFTSELKKPMNELETAKAKRQIAREDLVSEFSKWDPVVQDIRAAPQTIYSKREHGIKMHQALQPKPFVPRTSLELELYAALGKSEDILRPNEVMTVAEEKALKAMSIKEARARRAELLKHRELLSRMELKAKRMKKIKSKRYRKVLRKERIATEKKELEQLQKTDPDAFVEKMELLERARVEERLTLKHRGGGKFSRMHKAYSKFDDKTRAAMQDMLQKSRELTKKRQDVSSSDDDDDDEKDVRTVNREDNDEEGKMSEGREKVINPVSSELMKSMKKKGGGWLDGHHTEFIYTTEEQKDVQRAKEPSTVDGSDRTSNDDEKTELEGSSVRECIPSGTNKDERESLETENISKGDSNDGFTDDDSENAKSKKRKLGFEREGSSSETKNTGNMTILKDEDDMEREEDGSLLSQTQSSKSSSTVTVSAEEEGRSRKRKRRKKKSQTGDEEVLQNENNKSSGAQPPKEVTLTSVDEEHSDKDEEDEDVMKVTMEELFEDEDLVEAFAKEKADEEKKRKPKVEDTKLPGWGSWAGPDYKEEAEKRLNRKKKGKQKPMKKGNIKQPYVWLNPDRETSIRKFQPKKVPFPYTSVQQYEASLRQPISRGFVRETAFKLLTKPEVVTKQGHIIKPLNKDDHFEEKDIAAEGDDKNFGFVEPKQTTKNMVRKKKSRSEKKQERKSLS